MGGGAEGGRRRRERQGGPRGALIAYTRGLIWQRGAGHAAYVAGQGTHRSFDRLNVRLDLATGSRGQRHAYSLSLPLSTIYIRWHVSVWCVWVAAVRACVCGVYGCVVSWHGIVFAPFSHVLSEYAVRLDAKVRPVSELG